MEFDLKEHTLFLTVAGSWSYGTNMPTSDVDVRGFGLAPRSYRTGFNRHFEQCDSPTEMEVFKRNIPERMQAGIANAPLDGVVYDLPKFFKLAAGGNPNILDSIFADGKDILICDKFAAKVLDHRFAFLTKVIVHTFRGYAIAQLKKIERHRKWLLEPLLKAPTRTEFQLSEHHKEIPVDQMNAATASITKLVDSWEIDFGDAPRATVIAVQEKLEQVLLDWKIGYEGKWRVAGNLLGYDTNFLDLMEKERRYKQAMDHWKAFLDWKKGRNEKRAELEAKFGFDVKHAMHLVRLLQSCREILTTGDYKVRRPNAEELVSIRNGAWSYEKVLDFAQTEDKALLDIAAKSSLPRSPDIKMLDALCSEIVDAWEKEHP